MSVIIAPESSFLLPLLYSICVSVPCGLDNKLVFMVTASLIQITQNLPIVFPASYKLHVFVIVKGILN